MPTPSDPLRDALERWLTTDDYFRTLTHLDDSTQSAIQLAYKQAVEAKEALRAALVSQPEAPAAPLPDALGVARDRFESIFNTIHPGVMRGDELESIAQTAYFGMDEIDLRAAIAPTLDVERLARAVAKWWSDIEADATRMGGNLHGVKIDRPILAAEVIAREYAAFSEPEAPKP